jgi:hypothetical protein
VSDTLSHRADQATEEDKHLIMDASDQVGGLMKPDSEKVKLLFIMFDRYIETYHIKNLRCNDCRVMVRNFWHKEVQRWRTWRA